MQLARLIDNLAVTVREGDAERVITDLTDDSRAVRPGSLFIARAGSEVDGRQYIGDAIERGANAVLTELMDRPPSLEGRNEVNWLTAERVDPALCGKLAERFFHRPSRRLHLVGVTGTNGKTTTAFILQHLLKAVGIRAGLMGTIVVDDGEHRIEAGLTTPDAITFSRLLRRMVDRGCGAAVCEVSSHALKQGRTAALAFDVGVFTNLTGDHLDYHGSMADYAAAKARLFEQLPASGWAILNAEDPHAERMGRDANCHVLWTRTLPRHGSAGPADPDGATAVTRTLLPEASICRAHITHLAADHSEARFEGPWGQVAVALPQVGRHNVVNALQATAAIHALTPITARLEHALSTCPSVPGRLELVSHAIPPAEDATDASTAEPGEVIGSQAAHRPRANALSATTGTSRDRAPHRRDAWATGRRTDRPSPTTDQQPSTRNAPPEPPIPNPENPNEKPTVLVDYAHTHDALENVLLALTPVTRSALIVVFGCGGDRDKTKRPKMAAVAARLADRLYVTSDNPRTEEPDAIIRDIMAGLPAGKQSTTTVLPARAEAIATAIDRAEPADTVLIAGKGHEDYQILGAEKHHFDDREHAAAALRQYRCPSEA